MTTQRRFSEGQTYEFDGVTFRVVRGKKTKHAQPGDTDLRLDWWAGDAIGWVPVSMVTLGFMADFMFENENILYPPAKGFEGGGRFWRFIRHAMKHGWRKAAAGLEAEKAQRRMFEEDAA